MDYSRSVIDGSRSVIDDNMSVIDDSRVTLPLTTIIFLLYSGLYYKNNLTIISDACTMNILLALALELASVISYDCKWSHNLEHHLLMTLEVSFTIVVCLQYRPQTTVACTINICDRNLRS
jgi:hypothetical protein